MVKSIAKTPDKTKDKGFKHRELREIVSIEKKGDQVLVRLKGWIPTVLKYSLKSLMDFKRREKKWPGKWFLVFFDVPEKQRNKRDYLRSFLKDVGFYPYQQSVYIFPYECEEEIKLIKQIVESAKYLSYIVAERIEFEAEAKRHFNLI